jgi:hypothetical protein
MLEYPKGTVKEEERMYDGRWKMEEYTMYDV